MTYQKSRYTALKSAGLCVSCGRNPTESGKTRCPECSQKRSESQKTAREYRAKLGKCILCGSKTISGYKMCLECRMNERERPKAVTEEQRQKQNDDNRKRRERYKREHRCVACGKQLPKKYTKVRCPACNAKNRKATERYHRSKGVKPMDLAGNGHYCAVCLKPVEVIGNKLCDNCYRRSVKNIEKANEATDRSYFRGLNKVFWDERNAKK